jgi:FMN phosphatase YigB (HAD superfamily)
LEAEKPTARAWLFDLDGTLYRLRGVQLAMACELALLAPHWFRALACFRREQEKMRRDDPPAEGSPYQLQLERTARATGLPLAPLEHAVERWMQVRPGKWLRLFRRRRLLADIAAFRAAGGRTAVVSDYPAAHKLRAMRLADAFDVVVANGEPGGPRTLKPSPEGFLLAAGRLGIAPDACQVIGDRDEADGEAARRAGMRFTHVRDFRGLIAPDQQP